METNRKTFSGLAKILASAVLAGTIISAPASCTPQRTNDRAISNYSLEEQAYNFANSLINNRPKVSRTIGNGILYSDESLKFTELKSIGDRYDNITGKGRYTLLNEGFVSVGYYDADIKTEPPINKFQTAVVCGEENGKQTIYIANGPDIIVYSEGKDKWEKAFYDKSQLILILRADVKNLPAIPAKSRKNADKEEVRKWLELIEKLRISLAR